MNMQCTRCGNLYDVSLGNHDCLEAYRLKIERARNELVRSLRGAHPELLEDGINDVAVAIDKLIEARLAHAEARKNFSLG